MLLNIYFKLQDVSYNLKRHILLIRVEGSVSQWGDLEVLVAVKRKLDCDVLIHEHTCEFGVQQYNGKIFINPGNAAGSFSALNGIITQSFILMATKGDDIIIFNYMITDDEL